MTANYLPVLLSSVNVSSCDDSDICDQQVSSQVDYLSHQWQEEDVWRSWRSMTRQKNEIANGLRLENASWRTWWKQRKGLQTINPETLNWLKDSDVTWLYGPFHSNQTSSLHGTNTRTPDLSSLTPPPSPVCSPVPLPPPKSILKHRTVSQLLVAALPTPNPKTDLLDVAVIGRKTAQVSLDRPHTRESSSFTSTRRPHLPHTQSETNMHDKSPFRRESPPRIIADDKNPASLDYNSYMQSSFNPGMEEEINYLPASDRVTGIRKHISFNTFVEQRIAIDKPSSSNPAQSVQEHRYSLASVDSGLRRRSSAEHMRNSGRTSYPTNPWIADEVDDDDEGRESVTPSSSSDTDPVDETESGEDDDQPIEIKPRSRSSSINSATLTIMSQRDGDGNISQDDQPTTLVSGPISSTREHVTIAPIAPTLLKASSSTYVSSPTASSNSFHPQRNRPMQISNVEKPIMPPSVFDESELEEGIERDGDVPLLWVPPVGSGYEREFTLPDPEEPVFGLAGSRRVSIPNDRSIESFSVGTWIVTPPTSEFVERKDDYFSEERKGRTQERQRGDRRHRRFPLTVEDSLSPAETASSSNTASSSSRSRSRSRNRDLLSLSPERDGHISNSPSPSNSSSPQRGRSPTDVSPARLQPESERRGRTLLRSSSNSIATRSASRDRSRESFVSYGRLDASLPCRDDNKELGEITSAGTSLTAAEKPSGEESIPCRKPPTHSRGETMLEPTRMLEASVNNGVLSSKIADIRGYIGSIWS